MNTPNTLEGERGIPDIKRVSPAPWRKGLAIMIGVSGLAVASAYAMIKLKPVELMAESEQEEMVKASSVPQRIFTIEPDPIPKMPEPVAALPVVEPVTVVEPKTVVVEKVVYRSPPVPAIDKSRSRSLVTASGQQGTATAQSSNVASATAQGALFGQDTSKVQVADSSGSSTASEGVARAYASKLENRDTLITRGSMIGCVLNTRLNSQLSGMTSCRVTSDVHSTDGSGILIEAGSTVTGEYQSTVAQGMNRIGVIWDRVQTPSGIVVNLQSPATDQLGGTGIQGRVNNHFWKRFGGAILLSLVDDVASFAGGDSSGQVVVNSATGAGSDLAAEVLRNTINIPPTVEVNQGGRIAIFVSRDLDFGGV